MWVSGFECWKSFGKCPRNIFGPFFWSRPLPDLAWIGVGPSQQLPLRPGTPPVLKGVGFVQLFWSPQLVPPGVSLCKALASTLTPRFLPRYGTPNCQGESRIYLRGGFCRQHPFLNRLFFLRRFSWFSFLPRFFLFYPQLFRIVLPFANIECSKFNIKNINLFLYGVMSTDVLLASPSPPL